MCSLPSSKQPTLRTLSGGEEVLACGLEAYPTITKVLADQGYRGALQAWTLHEYNVVLEIVRPPAEAKEFTPQRIRWVIERTIAWLNRYRRLGRDYERLAASSEAMLYIASIHQLLQRLAPNQEIPQAYMSIKSKRATPSIVEDP